MTRRFPLLLIFITMLLSVLQSLPSAARTVRERHVMNRSWCFVRADVAGAERADFDDTAWERVNLPHTFSLPYFMWKDFYTGYGWYRRHLDVPAAWKGRRLSLAFEGAFIAAEVYVNGRRAGAHVGGYTGFTVDLTPFVRPGDNVIAVRVNNLWRADVAPRAGDHQFGGGIYRDVWLDVTGPLHVADNGIGLTTLIADSAVAGIGAVTTVRNDDVSDHTFTVCTTIFDATGRRVAEAESLVVRLAAGATADIRQHLNVLCPALWSPATPVRYTCRTRIMEGRRVVDDCRTPFGIRTVGWTAEGGFILNGKRLYLYGANVHQDRAGWGDAGTNAAFVRDVGMMKAAGFNAIRGSHYPHDPAFVNACDSLGLIYFSENAFWGMGGGGGDTGGWGAPASSAYPVRTEDRAGFEASVIGQLREMVGTFRNAPSIGAWSLCNEAFFSDAAVLPHVRDLLRRATDSVRCWDPSRPVAIGGCQRGGLDKLGGGQVAFYNGDGATFPDPGVPNMVSEYSSRSAQRPGDYSPAWGDIGSRNNFDASAPSWRGGQVIWCGFDHGTVGGEGLATMGLVDYFRLPKRQYYWYRDHLNAKGQSVGEPVWPAPGRPVGLRLESDKRHIATPDGLDDVQLTVTVTDSAGRQLSNAVPVTLRVVSGPGEFPTGRSITFLPPDANDEAADITIRDGRAAIDFRTYQAGRSVIEATSPGLRSARIELTTGGQPRYRAGVDDVAPRPYHRFIPADRGASPAYSATLAQSRPCSVTSNAPGRALANDGNVATAWRPAATDSMPQWQLDLEATYDVEGIHLVFPDTAAYRYVVGTSSDGRTWHTVADTRKQPIGTPAVKVADYDHLQADGVRFVRITFTGIVAGLSEVQVGGRARR